MLYLATMTIHHSPHMNLTIIILHLLQHPHCLHDGPVLVVVSLALHAEDAAVLTALTPLSS